MTRPGPATAPPTPPTRCPLLAAFLSLMRTRAAAATEAEAEAVTAWPSGRRQLAHVAGGCALLVTGLLAGPGAAIAQAVQTVQTVQTVQAPQLAQVAQVQPQTTAPDAASAAPGRQRFEDSIAQRTLACTACHGAQGRAGPDGYYPRLAGKPAGYLYNQLLNFRDGRRHYGLMTGMVDLLSDAYLMEIAQYFAGLEVPYPPARAPQATPAQLARGEQLALRGDAARQVPACAQCHGAALTGVQPATPGLVGLPRDYLNAQLGAWRGGLRRAHAPDCMATVAKRMTGEDVSAVAAWLASQPVPAAAKPVAPLATPLPLSCGSAIPAPGGRP